MGLGGGYFLLLFSFILHLCNSLDTHHRYEVSCQNSRSGRMRHIRRWLVVARERAARLSDAHVPHLYFTIYSTLIT